MSQWYWVKLGCWVETAFCVESAVVVERSVQSVCVRRKRNSEKKTTKNLNKRKATRKWKSSGNKKVSDFSTAELKLSEKTVSRF